MSSENKPSPSQTQIPAGFPSREGDIQKEQTQLPQQPGLEYKMEPRPIAGHVVTGGVGPSGPADQNTEGVQDLHALTLEEYIGNHKLCRRVAIITGGDSGIGRAIAVMFAKEGADIAIVYLPVEQKDAEESKALIEKANRKCLLIPKDVSVEDNCRDIAAQVNQHFGRIDILVNNSSVQYIQEHIEDLSAEQLEKTFRTNIFGMIFLAKHCVPYMKSGSSIINSTSVTAYKGNKHLIDYSATKGAIVSFTRSLALQLAPRGIRVNGVAPGPIWTPLQVASRSAENLEEFSKHTPPLGRMGQPADCGPSYVFLASNYDSSYMTGQILHPNGGDVING